MNERPNEEEQGRRIEFTTNKIGGDNEEKEDEAWRVRNQGKKNNAKNFFKQERKKDGTKLAQLCGTKNGCLCLTSYDQPPFSI